MIVLLSSGQNFWKKAAVKPSGSGAFPAAKEKRVSLTSVSDGVCVSQLFMASETIQGYLMGAADSTKHLCKVLYAILFKLLPSCVTSPLPTENFIVEFLALLILVDRLKNLELEFGIP